MRPEVSHGGIGVARLLYGAREACGSGRAVRVRVKGGGWTSVGRRWGVGGTLNMGPTQAAWQPSIVLFTLRCGSLARACQAAGIWLGTRDKEGNGEKRHRSLPECLLRSQTGDVLGALAGSLGSVGGYAITITITTGLPDATAAQDALSLSLRTAYSLLPQLAAFIPLQCAALDYR